MHIIPQSWSHLHILVSVFPSFGLLFVLGFYLSGLYADNKGLIRTCLVFFIGLALLALPTYLSGIRAVDAVPARHAAREGHARLPLPMGHDVDRRADIDGSDRGLRAVAILPHRCVVQGHAAPRARPRGRLARLDDLRQRLGDQSQRAAGDRRHSRRVDTAVVAVRPHDHQPLPDGRIRVRRRVPRDRPRDAKRSS